MPKPLILLAALALAAPASAQLAFTATTHDFGVLQEGEAPTYTFAFENEGRAPLTLTAVRPSCGCTTPSFTTEAVAPGGTGEIVVAYDSEGRPGPFRKSVRVTAEAGGETLAETLYITGTVEREAITDGVAEGNLLFDTDAVDLGPVPADRQTTHVFRMQHTGTRPIRIAEAKSVPEGLRIAYPNTPIFAGDLVPLRVTLRAGSPAGDFDYAIVLTTDDEAQPTKSLRLTGTAQ
ncbi:MAG: DUF1573 domain-containing protein [Bacteroidota bacterium]